MFDSAGALKRYVGAPVRVSCRDELEVVHHLNRARVALASDGVIVLARFLQPQLEFYDLSGRRLHTTHNVAPMESPTRPVSATSSSELMAFLRRGTHAQESVTLMHNTVS